MVLFLSTCIFPLSTKSKVGHQGPVSAWLHAWPEVRSQGKDRNKTLDPITPGALGNPWGIEERTLSRMGVPVNWRLWWKCSISDKSDYQFDMLHQFEACTNIHNQENEFDHKLFMVTRKENVPNSMRMDTQELASTDILFPIPILCHSSSLRGHSCWELGVKAISEADP